MYSRRRSPGMLGLLAVLSLLCARAAATAPTVAISACGAPAYDSGTTAWTVSCTATVTTDVALTGVDVLFDTAATPTTTACSTAIGTLAAGATTGNTCTVVYTLVAGDLGGTSVSLYAQVDASTPGTAVAGPTTVNLAKGALAVTPPATLPSTLKAGDTASVTVTLTNSGPVALVPAALPSGFAWADAACPGSSLAAGAASDNVQPCVATLTVADADLEAASAKTYSFALTATTLNPVVAPVTVTLPRTATISAAVTGCALSTARPATDAVVTCTATVTNTGTMRLKTFALTGTTDCTFTGNTEIAAGAARTCTFSKTVPWANFTTAQNVTVSIAATASVFTAGTGVSAPTATASTLFEAAPVASLGLVQQGLAPALVNTSGTVATGNFTLGNAGTVNLTSVTFTPTTNAADPRVAAIMLACAGFQQNGTLPAGSSLRQCTETLTFSNVTFIEGGDAVFNISAAAGGGVVSTQAVTIHVDNTPSLSLGLNTSKCSAATAASRAGSTITCTQAITLTNTGRVRLAVDDILVNSTLGSHAATCTLNAAALNLTAVNATLLPGDKLLCSFSVVTTQAVYEAGVIDFDVQATGVAAFGTNPTIAGVLGNVVYGNHANVTITRSSNLTVTASVIGSVKQDGDVVTYRVVVANQGNLQLSNVQVATNLPSSAWDLVNMANITDGLTVGEAVVLSSNITFNKTMIRAGAMNLTTNATARSATANVSATSFSTINTPWCADNRTARPSDHVNCLNDTDCGDANLRCDLTGPLTPRYTCWQGAVDVDLAYGKCVFTPCHKCRLCLAAMGPHVGSATLQATTDKASVADQFFSFCKTLVGANRTTAACEAAFNATRDSFQGNAGKRAGLICANLGECVGLPPTCSLATTGAATSLDLCTTTGVNASSAQVPGVVLASAAYAAPTCQLDQHCNNTAESVCVVPLANATTPPAKRAVCNPATGVDAVAILGTCQATPCRRCRECFVQMRAFGADQALQTDALAMASAFRAKCASLPYLDPVECARAALQIEASPRGNMGKRPLVLCGTLGACEREMGAACVLQANTTAAGLVLTVDIADACTTDGFPYAQGGQLLPSTPGIITNVAENATSLNVTDTGDCYSDADCGTGACSFANPKLWCQCNSTFGQDACTRIGKCVAAATCENCAKCVAAVAPFVRSQQAVMDGATVAANWVGQAQPLAAAIGAAVADAAGVSAAIAASPNGNLGKRAGALCSQMQFCAPSFTTGCPTTPVNTSIITDGGNTTTFYEAPLGLCTVEGIVHAGTTKVPSAADSSTDLPTNTCNQETNNCAEDYTCDLTAPPRGAVCVCDLATGLDTCTKYAACVRTPCKRCSDCLVIASTFTLAQQFNADDAAVKAALQTRCSAELSAQTCTTVANTLSATPLAMRRAGMICKALGECVQTDITAGGACNLRSTGVNGTNGVVDLCSVEGVTAGADLPRTTRAGLPAGMCDTAADCPGGDTTIYDCTKTAPKDFYKCTPSAGTDVLRQLGTCTLKPKVACEYCLRDFAGWAATANTPAYTDPLLVAPDSLAAEFYRNCTAVVSPARDAASCRAAAQGIATSYGGNKGRRAGAICRMLQECNPTALAGATVVPTGSGLTAAAFSQCTQTGSAVSGVVAGFPTTRSLAGFCTVDSNCTAGSFCDMTATGALALGDPGSCACSETTGRDECIRLGKCVPTPCTKCQTCLTTVRDTTNTSAPSFAGYSNAGYTTRCGGLSLADPATTCAAVATRYQTRAGVPSGYFLLRSGAVCAALQQCINVPATCTPTATTITTPTRNITAALDMCTAEGVLGGSQLNKVLLSGVAPAPYCLSDTDCTATAQCDTKNTTNFFTCSGGLDSVVSYGRCTPKPVAPTGTAQQLCSLCLDAMRPLADVAAANASLDAATLAPRFYTACATAGYALAACSRVQATIAISNGGNLARRTGALCMRLGPCSSAAGYSVTANLSALAPPAVITAPAVVDNSTNATVTTEPAVRTITGAADACTIEGIRGGAKVPNTFLLTDASPNATCVLDRDCPAGSLCSSDTLVRVCRCVDGLDSCDSLATCKPIPPPPAPPAADTRSFCQKCKDCLAAVNPWIASHAVGSNDGFALATAFAANCTGSLTANDVFKCRSIASAIAYSLNGNLAKRAGAICTRLGSCSAEAASASCNVTATARLDLCTQEGSVGGTALYATPAADNTTCTSDASCAAGSVCDMTAATVSCSCKADGTDTCQRVGTCQSFCASRASLIAEVNAALPKCDSPFAQCGTGLLCVQSTQCKQLTCSGATGITTQSCYGLCTPSVRTLLAAQLSNDGRSISVVLNTPAGELSFPCVSLFDTTTLAKVGSAALCSVSGSTLTVLLARDATITPNVDTLVLAASQSVLVDAIDPTAKFTTPATAITLAVCSACSRPVVTLSGPKTVPEPCDATSAADVVFDASSSFDASGRPLTKFAWAQPNTADVVLSAAISAANTGNKARLVIPGAALSQVADGDYMLTVTVTNYLGVTSTDSITFKKLGSGTAPVVTVLGGLLQAFSVAEGVKVSTALLPTSVCANKVVEWAWRSWDAWAAIPAVYSRKDLVIPGPVVGVADGAARLVGLTAKFAGSAEVVSVNVTLLPVSSPLRAVLRGPSGDVRADRTIVFNASSSMDADDPANSQPFGITWECARPDFPTPCFTGTAYGTQRGLTWELSTSLLTPGVAHTFTATVSKPGGREAAASLVITPRAAAIPTGRIVRVCGAAACPPRHSVDAPLALSVVADAGVTGATVAWSSDQVASLASFDGKTDIVLMGGSLPASGSVSVSATLTLNGVSSKTSVTVPINGKPLCSSAPASCLSVTAVSATFPGAAFKAEAVGFTDDQEGLRYDWGTVSAGARKLLASGPAPTFTFTGLPVGSTSVYVCAVDTDGAQMCQGTAVAVEAAPSTFKVSDALTNFDVTQLAGAGDVGVLAGGAQALQSLSKFAGDNTAGQSEAEQAQVQATIAVKTNALIKTLASNINAYLDDPQTMQQVVSSVATLSKTTKSLSSESKGKMLGVGQAGITAAKLSAKPLTPYAASSLLSVVAAGVGVPPVSGLKPAAAPQATRHLLAAAQEVGAAPSRQLLQDNATSPSPAPAGAPAPLPPFSPAYTDAAADVSALLLQSASPASGYKSSGDNGLFVAVTNLLGRSYQAAAPALAVGPNLLASDSSKADPSDKDNVPVSFSGNLVGSCTDDNGAPLTADGGCQVPVTAVYTLDASPVLDGTGLTADLPDGFTPVSGAITLTVGAAASGLLPCATAGCTAALTFPVSEAADVSKLYKCVRIAAGKMVMDDIVVGAASRPVSASAADTPTLACRVKQAGAYLVGRYPDPSYVAGGVPELATYDNVTGYAVGQPVHVQFKFGVPDTFDFDAFVSDAVRVASFKAGVITQLAKNLRMAEAAIAITALRQGSIEVDVTFATGDLTAAQLNTLVGTVENRPAVLFDAAFLATWGITGVTAKVVAPVAAAAALNIPAIVGGVVGGVGGALLVGGIALIIIRRRRAAGVEPRNARGQLLGNEHDA